METVTASVVQEFRSARRDPTCTVLEGFHAVKHALRFDAELLTAVATAPDELAKLAQELAPDLVGRLADAVQPVTPELMASLAPQHPPTNVMAIARRPHVDVAAALADGRSAPAVFLESPRNMNNVGACIRVAAAADLSAVLTTGRNDPWHPVAVRGAAGLHYALPVARVPVLPSSDRPLVVVDPAGEPVSHSALPPRAVLAFGSERYGLSDDLLRRADLRVRIPMRAGVSSLNLATSVASVVSVWQAHGSSALASRLAQYRAPTRSGRTWLYDRAVGDRRLGPWLAGDVRAGSAATTGCAGSSATSWLEPRIPEFDF